METIEDKIKKELDKKNINKKNYIWILSILVFTIIIIIYSYSTNNGIIAKQTINTQLVVKNQENLKPYLHENKINKEKTIEPKLSEEEQIKEAIVKDIIEKNIKVNPKKSVDDTSEELIDENILIDDDEQILLAEEELEEKTLQKNSSVREIKSETPLIVKTEEEPIETIQTPILETQAKEKDVVVPTVDNTNLVKIFEPKTNFNFYKCYGFALAQSSFPKSCEESLQEFIQANANAKRFELIGVIDIEDAKNLANKSDANQALLAKNRILSTRNFIKVKSKVPLSDHFYYIKSELPTRGFALRAYY